MQLTTDHPRTLGFYSSVCVCMYVCVCVCVCTLAHAHDVIYCAEYTVSLYVCIAIILVYSLYTCLLFTITCL